MESNSFRINLGECIVTDEEVIINESANSTLHRIYEGNKLFFTLLAIGIFWIFVSIIFDTWIFSREVALWILVIGVLIGGAISILWVRNLNNGNFTRDTVIPLTSIQSVDCSESGLFPHIIISYQKDDEIANRLLQFPYSWFSYTHEEYENAKCIFKDKEITINE